MFFSLAQSWSGPAFTRSSGQHAFLGKVRSLFTKTSAAELRDLRARLNQLRMRAAQHPDGPQPGALRARGGACGVHRRGTGVPRRAGRGRHAEHRRKAKGESGLHTGAALCQIY
ncbi:hypothetical protein PHYPSEUDO_002719 [Phytophthora pseudosyringae]|uniref:Uncharacterized protein n=1 Tax=Phytophthora pseudosyringae TaxID=221518 RepID=A0A8T1WIY4_9STRA|nr:hypothetical protein PHYPSEUDO_002719 [Phytophthora pseudosyringae]